MSALVIKNLPEHLHAQLRLQAQRNHRSVTKEAIQLLETGLAANTPIKAPLPPGIRLRGGHVASIEEIEAAIAEGQK
jgi:plasmid stability protein